MTCFIPTSETNEKGEAGFTLVEMLVGLALFSLLAVLLFNNISFGIQAWRSGSARADELQRTMVAQDVLRRVIGNLYPMAVAESGSQPRIDFRGTRETIEFLGDAPLVSGGAGRFRFRIVVDRQGDRSDLSMTATPELASTQDASASTRTVLISDIARAEFAYFGASTPGGNPQWIQSWEKQSDIPRLIRIRMALHTDDTRAWPDLLIAPRVRADVSCAYDPMTARCRGR